MTDDNGRNRLYRRSGWCRLLSYRCFTTPLTPVYAWSTQVVCCKPLSLSFFKKKRKRYKKMKCFFLFFNLKQPTLGTSSDCNSNTHDTVSISQKGMHVAVVLGHCTSITFKGPPTCTVRDALVRGTARDA